MSQEKIQYTQKPQRPLSVLRFGAEQFDMGDSLTILFLLFMVIGVFFLRLDKVDRFVDQQITTAVLPRIIAEPVIVREDHTVRLMEQLKTSGLWDLPDYGEIPVMIVNNYPIDFHMLEDIGLRKKIFLHTLLPTALLARHEVSLERLRLQSILAKINCSSDQLNFTSTTNEAQQCLWQSYLAADEVGFVNGLCKTYRTTDANELLGRVDSLPVSLILAQGALETSWGRSRFARCRYLRSGHGLL